MRGEHRAVVRALARCPLMIFTRDMRSLASECLLLVTLLVLLGSSIVWPVQALYEPVTVNVRPGAMRRIRVERSPHPTSHTSAARMRTTRTTR
jgi:hypothetical protein